VAVAAEWWAHALGWSAAGSLAAGLVLVAVVPLAPYGFLHDFPEDVQEAAAEPTPAQRRAGAVGGAVFLAVLLAVPVAVPLGWGLTHPGAPWWSLTAMAVVALAVFTAFDTVVVDWLVICRLRPSFLVLPGTEHCAGWSDYRFHLREVLRPRALALFPVLGGAVGTAVWGLLRLLG